MSLLLGSSGVGLSACAPVPTSQQPTPSPAQVEAGTTLGNVVLTQRNPTGDLLWQFKAQGVTYGADPSIAQVDTIQGQLYAAGQPVFQLQASQGEVHQAADKILLKGKVVATDLRHQVVFKGREVEWQPQPGRLQITSGLTLSHPQVQLWADQLQAFSRTQQVKVQGNVVIEGRKPALRLKADRAIWHLKVQQLYAGRSRQSKTIPSVEIEQLDRPQQRHRALAGTVQYDLHQRQLTLRDPAQITLAKPVVAITSQRLVWDLSRQLLSSPQLLEVHHQQQGIAMIAEQGSFDQRQQLATLNGRVEATGVKNRTRLTTNQLIWNVATQKLEALGNVQYRQNSPSFSLKGERAIGSIQAQTIQISGGDVVTEIVPE